MAAFVSTTFAVAMTRRKACGDLGCECAENPLCFVQLISVCDDEQIDDLAHSMLATLVLAW